MARKGNDGKPGNRPGLRVIDKTDGWSTAPVKGAGPSEAIFSDKRSGRDRRELQAKIGDSRRKAGVDRRQRTRARTSWWLERDYVESHHFVQKSSSGRARRRELNPTEE